MKMYGISIIVFSFSFLSCMESLADNRFQAQHDQLLALYEGHEFDPMEKDKHGRLRIHHALSEGRLDRALLLIAVAPEIINAPDPEGYTPLHLAICYNRLFLIKELHEAGASWELRNNKGRTPKETAQFLYPSTHAIFWIIKDCEKVHQKKEAAIVKKTFKKEKERKAPASIEQALQRVIDHYKLGLHFIHQESNDLAFLRLVLEKNTVGIRMFLKNSSVHSDVFDVAQKIADNNNWRAVRAVLKK